MKGMRTMTAIALALGLAASPAFALVVPDADGNNQISGDEWSTFGDESFGEVDADQSGYVDEDEFNDWSETNWGGIPGGGDDDGPLFGLLDVNDDQQVAEDEWFTEDQFATLDDNNDDVLSEEEFVTDAGASGGQQQASGQQQTGQQSAQQQTGQQQSGQQTGQQQAQELNEEAWINYGDTFSLADVDQSGYIDEEEYNSWAAANWGGEPGGGDDDGPLFGLLDVDDDQQIAEDEWFSEESFGELDDDESGVLDETEFGV